MHNFPFYYPPNNKPMTVPVNPNSNNRVPNNIMMPISTNNNNISMGYYQHPTAIVQHTHT